MLRSNKSESEKRFELLIIGLVMVVSAMCYVIFQGTALTPMMLFIPGLIMLGGAIFQDMQEDWEAGWFTYVIATIVVATGLAGILNSLLGELITINWLIIAIVELGAVLIAKALYDPSL